MAFKVIVVGTNRKPVCVPFRSYRSLLFNFRTLCVFEPPFGGLTTTYDVHLGLIGKRVVDFLLMLIDLFSVGVTDRKLAISLQHSTLIQNFR